MLVYQRVAKNVEFQKKLKGTDWCGRMANNNWTFSATDMVWLVLMWQTLKFEDSTNLQSWPTEMYPLVI
jgi:hypothetical protein